jgi:hypothetical protein
MRTARIATVAACLTPAVVACSSSTNNAALIINCEGADASVSDAGTCGALGEAASAEAVGEAARADDASDAGSPDAASADAVSDATVTDALDARAPSDSGGADADAATEALGVDVTAPTLALLRVADWSPDAPTLDFCIAPHGTRAFQGPVVAGAADGGAGALAFPRVSAYVTLTPGQYDVRLVTAGAGCCGVSIRPDATTLPVLAAGMAVTVALVGEEVPTAGDAPLQLAAFADDVVSVDLVTIRFINAAPALTQVDVGTGTIASFTPLFQGVPFGTASTPAEARAHLPTAQWPTVDANGYRELFGLSNATISVHRPGTLRDAAMPDTVVATGLSAAAGSVLTMALVGGTSAGVPARLLECVDNAGTVGPLSNCTLLP